MPMFVHNFTSYFHEKQRDLYFVTFSQVKRASGIARRSGLRSHPGTPRLLKWIKKISPRPRWDRSLPTTRTAASSRCPMTARSIWNLRRMIKRNSKAAGRHPTGYHSMNAGSATYIRSSSTRKNTAAAFRLLKNISTETKHHVQTDRHDINTQTSGSTGTA